MRRTIRIDTDWTEKAGLVKFDGVTRLDVELDELKYNIKGLVPHCWHC